MYNLAIYVKPPVKQGSEAWYHYENGYKEGFTEGKEVVINEKSIFYKEIAKETISFSVIIILSLIIGWAAGRISARKSEVKKFLHDKNYKPLDEW